MCLNNPIKVLLICVGFILLLLSVSDAQTNSYIGGDDYQQKTHLSSSVNSDSEKKKIIIAIVDDGVRITHKDIKSYIWQNPLENPDNGMDDDGNGYINDINGWDVADNDNDVTPPVNSRFDFYHGTHLTGIIIKTAEFIYGENASDVIRIMPIKSMKNNATSPHIRSGYEGIDYAINNGADIILTAWGVNHVSDEELKILKRAHAKDILVIASAGNHSTNKKQYPAAEPTVMSVAALDLNNKKTKISNFGGYVDISAPGEKLYSASFKSDTAYEKHAGTSQSAAIVTTVAAFVKLKNLNFSTERIRACIKNTADPIDHLNPRYSSKLGAGAIHIANAVECNIFNKNNSEIKHLVNPQGYLHLKKPQNNVLAWSIKPNGLFKGIRFRKATMIGDTADTVVSVFKTISSGSEAFLRYPLANLPESFYIPGTTALVQLESKIQTTENISTQLDGLLEYKAEPIDFTKLYCQDTLNLNSEGVIEDGSRDKDYSFNTSCKWLITAPEGKVIRFTFTELDTEPNVDKIYFFNGKGTHEKIMAIFSGNKLPPELITWDNKVLVWFVTDGQNQGQGWKAKFSFIDSQ